MALSRLARTLGLLAAFGPVALLPAPGSAQAPKPWRHGVIEPKSDAGFVMMASRGGFADKHGLKIEILPVKSDALGLKALLAGELDSYEGAPGNAIVAGAKGADVKILGCALPTLVHGIYVRSGIAKVEHLKGKAVAVSAPGAMPDLLVRGTLEEHGVPVSSVRFANLGGDLDRYKALAAGVVDAAVVSSEYQPIADKNVHLLLAAREAMPNFVRGCAITTAKTIAARGADAVRFMAAEIDSLRFAISHKAETVKLAQEVTEAKPEDPRAAFLFDEMTAHHDVDPDMPLPAEKLNWLQDLLVKTGGLSQPTDIQKLVDGSVRAKALAELGR